MGLKRLDETKEKEFIEGAKADGKEAIKPGKAVKKTFSKQTVCLDEKRYLKLTAYCKRRKITFQSLMIELIDDFFIKKESAEA